MKKLALLVGAALYGLAAVAAAQTLAQSFVAQLAAMSSKITRAQLSPELKNDFNIKLEQIARDAGCINPTARAGQNDCSRSTPHLIEAAGPKIAQLGRDVDAAVIEFGDKSLRIIYEAKLKDLSTRLANSKVIEPEKSALQARVKGFFLPYKPGSLRDSAVSLMEQEYQRLVLDFEAAVRLSAESNSTKPFVEQYRSKVDALAKKIDESKINRVVKADLQRALTELASPILGSTLGAKGLPTRSPSEIADASANLVPFAQRVESTIAATGGKTFAEMMTPRIDAMEKKLREIKLDASTTQNLQMRLDRLRRTLASSTGDPREGGLKGGGGTSLAQFEAELAAVEADLAAAISLDAMRGRAANIVAAFSEKMAALKAKIMKSSLDRFIANFYAQQADVILREGCAVYDEPANKTTVNCQPRVADASNIASASVKADALSAAVDEAIKSFGNKTMAAIYKERAESAKKSLAESRLADRDRAQLVSRIDAFMKGLDRRLEARGETPETVERDWRMIMADIEAAIRLAASTSAPPKK